MSDYSADRGARPEQPSSGLRLAALAAVVAGVVLLAAAAFVFSYSGIHQIARNSGVTPGLARVYPLIFDAMLVIAGAAVLALRSAGWWTRSYVWFCLLLLLTGVAAGDAVRAMHVSLPAKPSRAAVAVTPWVLVLLAFGMWLAMLRHLRRTRAMTAARRRPGQIPHRVADSPPREPGESQGMAEMTGVTWASGSGAGTVRRLPSPRTGLDNLLNSSSPGAAAAGPPAAPAPSEDRPAEDKPATTESTPATSAPDTQPGQPAVPPATALPATPATERHSPESPGPGAAADTAGDQPSAAPPADAEPDEEQPPPPPFDRLRSTPTPPED